MLSRSRIKALFLPWLVECCLYYTLGGVNPKRRLTGLQGAPQARIGGIELPFLFNDRDQFHLKVRSLCYKHFIYDGASSL